MPRAEDLPACPAKPTVTSSGDRTYDIELITPLFGGGVVARENDIHFPIRPTSIRGQLQFWWRATVGAQFTTRQQLRDAQSALWGNTQQASRVQVRVDMLEPVSQPQPCATFQLNSKGRLQPIWESPFQNSALPYALFPFQGQASSKNNPQVEPASCIHRAKFRLTIRIDPGIDWASSVEPALWAWVNFGGLGSRTRRGCGALKCSPWLAKDRNDLMNRVKVYRTNGSLREWPTLAEAFLVGRTSHDPIEAWKAVISIFRNFRQGESMGRNPGSSPQQPGRSRWPEPETIRSITKQRNPRHGRMNHIPDDACPRAEFGLPIVFHFKDPNDPPDTVLYPGDGPEGRRERMASPLILKPVALQNGQFVPVIVRLRTPPLTSVDWREGTKSLQLRKPLRIRDPQLANYEKSPLQGRSPSGSAIEAFLAYARSLGFEEVG
ncbi:MAG: type III-B CRISPR module RAMP protein Cmr1 [Gemmataceae bacterium]|nr:type III-B CRISPR module RAMP protein Cmr1 [Gemmata sp.]MDW8199068.1 type III-B CRISPR module RAMP protein Cmr1 [Gemmataceae bacterium]